VIDRDVNTIDEKKFYSLTDGQSTALKHPDRKQREHSICSFKSCDAHHFFQGKIMVYFSDTIPAQKIRSAMARNWRPNFYIAFERGR
jgi:hypothetical protein